MGNELTRFSVLSQLPPLQRNGKRWSARALAIAEKLSLGLSENATAKELGCSFGTVRYYAHMPEFSALVQWLTYRRFQRLQPLAINTIRRLLEGSGIAALNAAKLVLDKTIPDAGGVQAHQQDDEVIASLRALRDLLWRSAPQGVAISTERSVSINESGDLTFATKASVTPVAANNGEGREAIDVDVTAEGEGCPGTTTSD